MEHSDFQIGAKFMCGDRLWLCTDIGTRVIVAVRADWTEVEERHPDGSRTRGVANIVDDPTWLNGPPYALAERVFDEDDLPACEPA